MYMFLDLQTRQFQSSHFGTENSISKL